MNITIVGIGYVGLVSSACFAEMGNNVVCVDVDVDKVNKLKKGIIPIYEPGLEFMVLKNVEKKNLSFTTKLELALEKAEVVFIAVGTPMGEDGAADIEYVLNVAKEIGLKIKRKLIIVNKSTVPVGTADKVRDVIRIEQEKRGVVLEFDVVSNPEFLKEGTAIGDFMKPDRVIIGVENEESLSKMRELYSPFFRVNDRLISMSIRSAEMTKYAANAMLATKISFINEMANICELVGADVNDVRVGIGSDNRIGYSFMYPGAGYGGSCFVKDVKALKNIAEEYNYHPQLISAVEDVNNRQKLVIPNKVVSRFGEDLSGKRFALWGLSFKPGTDDMREAPSLYLIKELVSRGAEVNVYDPKAMRKAQDVYLKGVKNVFFFDAKYDVLKDCEALILLTEWKEFRSPDFDEIIKGLKSPIIFDGRNQYMAYNLEERGIEYYRIGN